MSEKRKNPEISSFQTLREIMTLVRREIGALFSRSATKEINIIRGLYAVVILQLIATAFLISRPPSCTDTKPKVPSESSSPSIVPEKKPKKICLFETILSEDLQTIIAEVEKVSSQQFHLSDTASLKQEELGNILEKIQRAFKNLGNHTLETSYNGRPIKDDCRYAVEITEGPYSGEIVIIREFTYTQTGGENRWIDSPEAVQRAYFSQINETEEYTGLNRDHDITLVSRAKPDPDNPEPPPQYRTKLLAVKKKVNLAGKNKEVIYAPPHAQNLQNPYLVLKGYQYLQKLVDDAYEEIERKRTYKDWPAFVRDVPREFVVNIILTENLDHKLLIRQSNAPEFVSEINKILITLALNGENAFIARNSKKDARGMSQIIESTYHGLKNSYDEKGELFTGNFVADSLNHPMAAKLTLVHLYNEYQQIIQASLIRYDATAKTLERLNHPADSKVNKYYSLNEVLAAGYNSNLASVLTVIENNKDYPEDLKEETRPYIKKMRVIEPYLQKTAQHHMLLDETTAVGLTLKTPEITAMKPIQQAKKSTSQKGSSAKKSAQKDSSRDRGTGIK